MAEKENVKFEVEILDSEGLSDAVTVMLVRECTSFITTFAAEWLNNIEILADSGFLVSAQGELICTKQHFKKQGGNLGKFIGYKNLMEVGEAIQKHMAHATHLTEKLPAPFQMGE